MGPPARRIVDTRSRLEEVADIEPRSRADFRGWLEKARQSEQGAWVIYTKKSAEIFTLSYADIVEECLCFGWIDSTGRKLDDERSKLYVCPRKPNSGWSSVNKIRIEKLKEQGLMHQAGIECIERAQEHGSWTRFDAAESLAVPAELRRELKKYPHAPSNFDAFPKSARKAMLQWLFDARRPETRAKRVAEIAQAAEANRRAK